MALREELLERFGPFTDKGREFAFDLFGRDPGELGGLREFGKLRIEAGKVIVTLNKATRKIIKLERAAQRAAAKVERAALKATRSGRKASAFGITDDGVKAGPVLIGRGGVSPNRAFLRNTTGGAFTASVGVHLLGGGLSGAADLSDKMRELDKVGATRGERLRTLGAGVGGGVASTVLSLVGSQSLAEGISRQQGMSEEEFEARFRGLMTWLSSSREEVERIRESFKEKRLEVQRQTDVFFRKLWERINFTLPQTFTLRGKRELEIYRRDMRDLNADSIEKRQQQVRREQGRQAQKEARGLP